MIRNSFKNENVRLYMNSTAEEYTIGMSILKSNLIYRNQIFTRIEDGKTKERGLNPANKKTTYSWQRNIFGFNRVMY